MAEAKKKLTRKSGARVKKKTVRKKSKEDEIETHTILNEGSGKRNEKTRRGDLKKRNVPKERAVKKRTDKEKTGNEKIGKDRTNTVQQARTDGPEGEDLRQTSPPQRKARRLPSLSRMERDVRFVLMDLMASSDSDSVRVAAAKALMDKVNKEQGEVTDEQERRTKERADAIAEAGRLLAELAALKSFGARHKAKVA